MVASPTPAAERHLVVAVSARELKRQLGPMAWAVLEDVALDAEADEAGRLVATTSTRRVADNLGLTPGTTARALARLRSMGLVSHTRHDGPAGRFGLSAYVLAAIPGVEVRTLHDDSCDGSAGGGARPGVGQPGAGGPRVERPRPAAPRVGDAPMATTATAARRRRPAAGSRPGNGQLDLLGGHLSEATVSGHQLPSAQDTSR